MLALIALGGGVKTVMDHGIEGLMYSLLGGSAPPGSYFHPGMICVTEEQLVYQDSGGSFCEQNDNCTHLDPGTNSGVYVEQNGDIDVLVIKAGVEYHIYETGMTDDGCYYVTIEDNIATWERVGTGPECQDISHLQMWYATFLTTDSELCSNWDAEPPPY